MKHRTSLIAALGVLALATPPLAQQATPIGPRQDRTPIQFQPLGILLDKHATLTNQASVTITGRALVGAVAVEIGAPTGMQQVPVTNTRFTATIPLDENRVNQIFFNALDVNGASGPSVTTFVTMDNQPPTVAIDFPLASADITTNVTDVAGRVGDSLSGFEALTVDVNGIAAIVDVGVGTNGTFFVQDIPLLPGQRNLLQATATDALGNQATAEIFVEQVVVGPGVPSMAVQSGNGQIGMVGTELPNQIVVEVLDGAQQPFANKIVTFDITRSDGGLSETSGASPSQMLQVRTDSSGIARAFWTLGSDAGCGNNRVEVTSTNIAGTVFFCASGAPGPAAQIAVGMGNNQMGQTGSALAEPLRVWVHDNRNPVPGVVVVFQVTEGNGGFAGQSIATAVTDVTGHAQTTFTLGATEGLNRVQATFAGNPTAPVSFVASGIESDPAARTVFRGLVLNNSREPLRHAHVELSIAGVGMFSTESDVEGEFVFDDLPSGGVGDLHVDGATVDFAGGPGGAAVPFDSYPALHFEPIIVVEGAESSLPIPVLLPPLDPLNAQVFDATQDLVMTIRTLDAMGQPAEVYEGLEFLVTRDTTVTLPNGTRVGPNDPGQVTIQLNQVHSDDIPMPMPDGASPPFAWTLKPTGATFDPPVQISIPNMSGREPGEVMYFLSFDHDTNRFEIVATGAVSEDGSMLVSDPGSGIIRAGWGGFCPPYPMTGMVDGEGDEEKDQPIGEDEEKPENPPAAPDPERIKRDCPKDEQLDPVYLFSGEFYEEIEDLRIKGRGMDFVWSRKYRSKTSPMTAQGNGWDCSYNIFIAAQGQDILLCDGNSRADTYVLQPNGTWVKQGYFRELSINPNMSYTLEFEDTGTWEFFPLDGSPTAGRVSAIVDRYGNTISFAYTPAGRLSTITDTLGRDIQIAYNANGFIDSVTDFIGRQVRYDYYQNIEPGGSFGDLKSVRTPTVTGTPTGNDYPSGKTTVYTYSEDLPDARLNGNLLTIRDPKGQVYLQNVYAATQNPADLEFDRIVRQVWGDAGDILDVSYEDVTPNQQNGFAIVKTTVNDRVGNVGEFYFDDMNVGVMERLYTGRADPDQPTTATANRPTGKLRPADPDFFERRQTFNRERRLTSVTEPDGSQVVYIYEGDLDSDSPARKKGNLRVRVEVRGDSTADADQASISEILEYDDDFGSGCCGAQFVSRVVDGRGNVTRHEYDTQGSLIRTIDRIPSIMTEYTYNAFGQITSVTYPANDSGYRRVDTHSYYTTGPSRGYVREIIVDAGGANLATQFEHDAVGNITRITDPRGNDTVQVFNDLDQVVRYIEREVAPGLAQRYEVDLAYDANDNVVRIDRLNVDDTGALATNAYLSTLIEYETLNNASRVCQESGSFDVPRSPLQLDCAGLPASEFITVEHSYDANRNRTLTAYGEATEARDPNNVVLQQYDERDFFYRTVRGAGSPEQSSTQYTYDQNGNLVRVDQGLEGVARVATGEYDYFDRLVREVDPMGNETLFSYDANGNVVRAIRSGELIDAVGGSGNVLLGDLQYEYDALDRRTAVIRAFFDTATGAPIQGGQANGASETRFEYCDASMPVGMTNDNGHRETKTYDTVYRLSTITDAKGNTVTRFYDENSNLVASTDTEISDVNGAAIETFTTTLTYDGLDRMTSRTDGVGDTAGGATGNTLSYGYDSRGNLTHYADSLGNVTRREFDGIDRLVTTRRLLTDNGIGTGAPIGEISTEITWDDSHRIRSRIESPVPPSTAGNETRFAYDALDRPIVSRLADGRIRMIGTGASWPLANGEPLLGAFVTGYDVHDNITLQRDTNGTAVSAVFDLLNRQTQITVAPGPGVSPDTTFEQYSFDGRSRIVRAEDDDSIVSRSFDSLSNRVSETLNGQTITSAHDGARNRTFCRYPGGREFSTSFDEVERMVTIEDVTAATPSLVAMYEYVGQNRVARRTHGNNTRSEYSYDGIAGVANPAGDFGERRVTRTRHVFDPGGANTLIDQRAYTWDRMGNKTSRRDTRPGGPGIQHVYDYDSVYRVGQSTARDAGMTLIRDVQYDFDDVGNRRTVAGGSRPGAYTLVATLPDPADRQVNQYTSTSFDSRQYDDNGNLTHHAPAVLLQPNVDFDFRNRMVEYREGATGERHTYRYDALGRRIERTIDADSVNGPAATTRYYYDDWRVCEEQSTLGVTTATYVYGRYVDEVLQMQRASSTYYYHSDDLYSVVALTDASGSVVERYEYDDYGEPVDPASLGALTAPASSVGNPYLFQGRRLDPETAWYHYRTRYLDPIAGRFITRDRIGAWGDSTAHGNAFTFAGNNPMSRIDPYGTNPINGALGSAFSAGSAVNTASGRDTPGGAATSTGKAFVDMNRAMAQGIEALEANTAAREHSRLWNESKKGFDPKTGRFNETPAASRARGQMENARARGGQMKKAAKNLGRASGALAAIEAGYTQLEINERADKRREGNRGGYFGTLDTLEKMRKKYMCKRAKGHITQEELAKKLEWIRKTQDDARKEWEDGQDAAQTIQVLETVNNLADSLAEMSGAGSLVKGGRDLILSWIY